MHTFEWDESLSVGVAAIDEDHKELISIINTLLEAIRNHESPQILKEIFDWLDQYVTTHFAREEVLMKKHRFPELEEHIRLHREFQNKLPKLKEQFFSADSHETALNIYQFLADWLVNHIIKEDLKYTKYIHSETLHKKRSLFQKLIHKLSRHITIRMRLWALTSIPIFVILILVFSMIKEHYDDYLANRKVYNSSQTFISMNRLTNALQLERGLSIAYSFKRNSNLKNDLITQQHLVQQYYEKYTGQIKELYSPQKYRKLIQNIDTQYSRIKKCRQNTDQNKCSIHHILNTYTLMIHQLLNQEEHLSKNVADKMLRSSLISLASLLYQKEQMGLKRAIGTILLQKPKQTWFKREFITLDEQEKFFRKVFLQQADEIQKKEFFSLLNKEPAQLSRQYTEAIIKQIIEGREAGIASKEWFKTMTESIELFKVFIDREVKHIQEYTRRKTEAFTTVPLLWIGVLVLLGILFTYFILLLEKSIYDPIKKLSDLLIALSKGERNIHFFRKHTKDEFGLLQDAYEALRIELLKSDRQEIKIHAHQQKAENLENIAFYDPLTGALNRRKFEDISNYELLRSKHNSRPLSLLIIDADYFKSINDNYGHANGDIVLQKLVTVCKKHMRSLDHIFRFGGEEFIILLPETDINTAAEYAQRLCKIIASEEIVLEGYTIKLTVSIGVSALQTDTDTKIEDVLKRADNALYKAKNEGRNRVITEL